MNTPEWRLGIYAKKNLHPHVRMADGYGLPAGRQVAHDDSGDIKDINCN